MKTRETGDLTGRCGLNECLWYSSNSYVDILMPKMVIREDGDFGRCLGPEGGALVTGTSALVEEAPERALAPPAQPRR